VHYVFIGMSNELGELESGLAAALIGAVPAVVLGGALAIGWTALVAVLWPRLGAVRPLHELAASWDGTGQAAAPATASGTASTPIARAGG
jgi:hypothetical protein